jgi:hypothetical protein
MKKFIAYLLVSYGVSLISFAQVRPSYLYNTSMPYGTLDIRTVISPTHYYYLEEGKTFSYRETTPGVRSNTYRDMTSWDSSPYLQGNLRLKNETSDKFVMNYRLLIPKNYQTTYNEGYPLIVLMHGGGERGNCYFNDCYHSTQAYDPNVNSPPAPTTTHHQLLNNDENVHIGGRQHLDARNLADTKLPNDPALPSGAFPGFVIIPQMLNGWDSLNVEDLIRIVQLHCKVYNIDQNRIYIHGLSIGGYGVYEAIQRAPWLFAAALPISAVKDANIFRHNLQDKVSPIPLWIFQGATDKNPRPSATIAVMNYLKKAGAAVRYTEYPAMGHGIWDKAYSEPDFFSWMLLKNKANILPHGGNTVIDKSKNQYPKLLLTEGFLAYQWQLNGQIIAGATSAVYVASIPGIYKARFSRIENPTETQWNKWSEGIEIKEESVTALPKAVIRQEGTVVLKDLNNFTDARLHALGNFSRYYWYKNGIRIDFPGDLDDTIKNPVIKPAMGTGVYTLVTANADGNLSSASEGKYIFFNNEAPVNITAPANFIGFANTTGINLQWTDASRNENGFELWRRRKITMSTFSPWELVTLTDADEGSYTDANLIVNAAYQYKIRAVSNTGRSNYTPNIENLEVIAGLDTEPPSAPGNLEVIPAGIQKFKLTWNASKDRTGVRQYYVFSNGDSVATNSTDTTYLLSNLVLNSTFSFKIKAVDIAGNLSLASNVKQGNTFVSGLFYEYYTGTVRNLDSVQWDKPTATGVIPTFSLSAKTQENFFQFRFDGFLSITKSGTYQFRTGSDDGSRLYLDNAMLIDNNGVHNFKIVTSNSQSLAKGIHRIQVVFFDYEDADSLVVEYKGMDTGDQWSSITAGALKSTDSQVVTAVEPNEHAPSSFVLHLFPNPTTSYNIVVTLQSLQKLPVFVQLLDPMGKSVFSDELTPADALQGVRLSLPFALSPGIYFVIVHQGNSTARQRVAIGN